MTQPVLSFMPGPNAVASGSSFNVKRKLSSDQSDDEDEGMPVRVKSPPLKRRATFPAPVPDLVADHSNSASDEDMAMDQDGDGDMGMDSPAITSSVLGGDGRGYASEYSFGMSGSGGIGFGPGAEEDSEMMDEGMAYPKPHYPTVYPSLTAHTNPNHFSNIPPYTVSNSLGIDTPNPSVRPRSPLSAQTFSTSLRAPARGLFQPTLTNALPVDASEIEKARSAHGPCCKSIPKLVISPHPDATTGKQAMYSMCPDCGTCERAA